MSEPTRTPPDPIDPTGAYLWDPATNDWVMNPAYGQAPIPPDTKGGTGRTWLIIIGIVTAVLLAAIVFSGGSDTTSPPPPAPTPTTAEPTPTPEPTTEVTPVLDPYIDLSDRIISTTGDIAAAGNAGDVEAMDEACSDLSDVAADGLALPDSNVPGVDKEWDAAMQDYADAALNCGVADYERAATFINKATAHISAATEALDAYTP